MRSNKFWGVYVRLRPVCPLQWSAKIEESTSDVFFLMDLCHLQASLSSANVTLAAVCRPICASGSV